MRFKLWFEDINYNSTEVTIPQGTVLYHGTLESFDSRKLTTGGYDGIFWTTDNTKIARIYIPSSGSSLYTSVDSIIRDEQLKGIRNSLGLSNNIISLAWKKHNAGYKNLKYWDDKKKEFYDLYKQNKNDIDFFTDDFMTKWKETEENYIKSQKEWKMAESYLRSFVVHKMKAFGYEPTNNGTYFKKIITDKDGSLLKASTKSVGKVLKITCKRDFRFFNLAYRKDGDLMDVDYRKIDLFRKLESSGYDGVIINDFAQSDYWGNYGHKSLGFFKNSIKDLSVKQIRNQTHPDDKEWQ